MIQTETLEKNGRMLIRTYSDRGVYIQRDGVRYESAVDPIETGRTYTETDDIIPVETGVSERVDALETIVNTMIGTEEE